MDSIVKNCLVYCQRLPKVELHAHINGSISSSTMAKLIEIKRKREPEWRQGEVLDQWMSYDKSKTGSLKHVFEMFSLIHEVSDSEEAAYIVTCDVIQDFAADNVKYLELRSTPRAVPAMGMTKRSYVETVLKAIRDTLKSCNSEAGDSSDLDIVVHLMLSIDRSRTMEDAMNTVELAVEYAESSGGVILGVDLSGNPYKGDDRDFLPALHMARSKGLKLALHLAEIDNQSECILPLLKLPPDRIGHGTFIHQGTDERVKEMVSVVEKYNIPLELCPSSNVICQTVPSFDKHHFMYWHKKQHPLSICTDDKGVFFTSLSEEFSLVAETFHLTPEDLWTLACLPINYIFAGEEVKQRLQNSFQSLRNSCLPNMENSS